MLKVFKTKRNSNYTQHSNQIYEKSMSCLVDLIPVFSDGLFHLIFKLSKKAKFSPIFCLVNNSHILCDCCSDIS